MTAPAGCEVERYDAVLAKWADPDADYEKLGEEQADLEAKIEASGAWDLKRTIEIRGAGARTQSVEMRSVAEATALAATTQAYAARARVQKRVETADQVIAETVAKLAEVSGVDRAAQLLDQPVGLVKRAVQAYERDGSRAGASARTPD